MKFLFTSIKSANQKGFTLIELLVVLAVIGVLAGVILTSISSARSKTRDAKRKRDMTELRTALELYATSNGGAYPSTGGTASWRGTCSGFGSYGTTGSGGYVPDLAPTHIPVLPQDPKPSAGACYLYTSNGVDYKFLSYLTIENNCPPLPNSFGFYDPARSASTCSAGFYTPNASAW